MANPQRENGYIGVSTEYWDALVRTRIPGEARQVLDFVIRKTWGYHKKKDRIATVQFIEGTGLSRRSVERARSNLRTWNLITTDKKDGSHILTYAVNKDYETWKVPTKKVQSTDKNVGEVPTKMQYTIDNKDKTIDKNQPQAAAPSKELKENPQVKEAMDQVLKAGFNIYAMVYKAKISLKQPQDWQFPDQVILKVCDAYNKERGEIIDPWPWFMTVLTRESKNWFAEQNIAQAQTYKKDSGASSLAEILKGVSR